MSLTHDNIKFLALARATDKFILCSYTHQLNNTNNIYIEMLNKVLRAPTWKQQVEPNSRHTLECEPNKFHFTMDSDHRVFIAITAGSYPVQIAFKLLTSFQEAVITQCGVKALTCRENGLERECHKIMSRLATEYDDRTKQDKISKVLHQVDGVKTIMQENIQTVLANTEKMESVEEKTNELNRQAKAFRNTGKTLRRRMWWKNLKLTLMIGFIIILVIIIILASLGVFKSSNTTTSTPNPAPAPIQSTIPIITITPTPKP